MASPSPSSSAAYRYLFMVLLGLLLGIVATVMLMRALQARRDPYPDALMQVMAAQVGQLQQARQQNRCSVSDAMPRLQSLRALSNDLEQAFPSLRDDRRFVAHAVDMRARLDSLLAALPADCNTLAAASTRIEDGCKACHQDFR